MSVVNQDEVDDVNTVGHKVDVSTETPAEFVVDDRAVDSYLTLEVEGLLETRNHNNANLLLFLFSFLIII